MVPSSTVTVLDGGLSTALEQQGVEVGGALWTASLLAEAPERIRRAHRSYFDAGADVATAATYQASEEGFREAGFDEDEARRLIARGVALAIEARDQCDAPAGRLVAASVGPYGAVLADGSEYRGRYGVSAERLRDFHAPRLELLAAAGPDLLAVETIPDVDEAVVIADLLDEIGLPAWVSYSIRGPETCAGQPLREAYAALADCSVLVAAGVNCSAEGDVLDAVRIAVEETGLPAVAYPNRGGQWDPSTKCWSRDQPFDVDLIDAWIAAGATYIGGCCGSGPSDIEKLARRVALSEPPAPPGA
ncbi:homocysteine S-methyltransferase [Microbacterium hominis]|uniref:Homocysteine S-methyltransferase n=1 Tax=Microbacterium hominis TaxID=162426 RepID=A0A7D4UCB8_9MICO|nr:homocysteine S-methyltransferase [Microbacterium hominis]QKJ20503.1 homocysteine S-methyltransferase [Microbacterium hominis]